MSQQELNIEELNDLLQQWNGQSIRIVKKEMEDTDEIILDIREVSYNQNESIDDYVPKYSLQLNGSGFIETTMNNFEPLPSKEYEIPLEENASYAFDGSRFTIHTSRGSYMIERA